MIAPRDDADAVAGLAVLGLRLMLAAVVAALVIAAAACLHGCGPSYGRGASAFTKLGNPVFIAPTLDNETTRASVVAQLDAAEAAAPWPTYARLTFSVEPYPVRLSFPITNPFTGAVINEATSVILPESGMVRLSWLDGKAQDIAYELANERCNCESGLR